MDGYAVALSIHLLSMLLATAASGAAGLAALRLRRARDAGEAMQWLALVGKVVPAFPIASLGLLASGAYMTWQAWSWTMPWVVAGLVGLAMIVMLGSGVEGPRMRLLKRELEASGLSPKARRLLRDPVAWTAKLATLTLLVAVVLVMALKPDAIGAAGLLVAAGVVAAVAAIPFWRAQAGGGGSPVAEHARS